MITSVSNTRSTVVIKIDQQMLMYFLKEERDITMDLLFMFGNMFF